VPYNQRQNIEGKSLLPTAGLKGLSVKNGRPIIFLFAAPLQVLQFF
jgi:hypothetical protein